MKNNRLRGADHKNFFIENLRNLLNQEWPAEGESFITGGVRDLEDLFHIQKWLLAEIMTTITMPGNQIWFKDIPESWHHFVRKWKEEYEKIKAKERELYQT